MKYSIMDEHLHAKEFLIFVNQIWPGTYEEKQTEEALSKTIDITAYDGQTLVGCLRILSDGYFFGTITELLVLPAYQKKGIGSQLLKFAHRKTTGRR